MTSSETYLLLVLGLVFVIILIGRLHKEQTEKKKTQTLLDRRLANRARFTEDYNDSFPEATDDLEPKFIFIDVETTDLPPQYNYVPDDDELDDYPHIVQASALVINAKAESIAEYSAIIKPTDENAYFSPTATGKHGITKEIAFRDGVPFIGFVDFIRAHFRKSSFLIAHNMEFDNLMIRTEAKRYKKKIPNFRKFCTMKSTYDIVGIPSVYGGSKQYKYPTLQELLVCAYFDNDHRVRPSLSFHQAGFDCRVCALCFFELDLYQYIAWKDERREKRLGNE